MERPIYEERVPPCELAVRRGERVRDSKGERVGSVDEFLVSPEDGHVTHLVLREGHLWGRKDVTIPVSRIERVEEAVHLRLDREQIAALPATPIHRRWWS